MGDKMRKVWKMYVKITLKDIIRWKQVKLQIEKWVRVGNGEIGDCRTDGRFDSIFDLNSNLNARFDSRFDSNANGRFAGPCV